MRKSGTATSPLSKRPITPNISFNNASSSEAENKPTTVYKRRATPAEKEDIISGSEYDTSLVFDFEDESEIDELILKSQEGIRESSKYKLFQQKLEDMDKGIKNLNKNQGKLDEEREYESSTSNNILNDNLKHSRNRKDNDTDTELIDQLLVFDDDESITHLYIGDHSSKNNKENNNKNSNNNISRKDQNLSSKVETINVRKSTAYEGDNEKEPFQNDITIDKYDRVWELEKENRELARKITELEQKLILTERREKNATNARLNESELVRQVQSRTSELEEKNEKLYGQKKELSERIQNIYSVNKELTNQNEALTSEVQRLRELVRSYGEQERFKHNISQSNKILKNTNEQLEDECRRLMDALSQREIDVSQLREQNSKLQNEMLQKNHYYKKQQKEFAKFVEDFEQMKSQFVPIMKNYENMSQALQKTRKMKREQKKQIDQYELEIKRLGDENKRILEQLKLVKQAETKLKRSGSTSKTNRSTSPVINSRMKEFTSFNNTNMSNVRRSPIKKTKEDLNQIIEEEVTDLLDLGEPGNIYNNISSIEHNPEKFNDINNNNNNNTDSNSPDFIPFFKDPEYLIKKLISERYRLELKNIEIEGLKSLLYQTRFIKKLREKARKRQEVLMERENNTFSKSTTIINNKTMD
ncbi:hypothetical protein ABK040_016451 [Willaertia magna]